MLVDYLVPYLNITFHKMCLTLIFFIENFSNLER